MTWYVEWHTIGRNGGAAPGGVNLEHEGSRNLDAGEWNESRSRGECQLAAENHARAGDRQIRSQGYADPKHAYRSVSADIQTTAAVGKHKRAVDREYTENPEVTADADLRIRTGRQIHLLARDRGNNGRSSVDLQYKGPGKLESSAVKSGAHAQTHLRGYAAPVHQQCAPGVD